MREKSGLRIVFALHSFEVTLQFLQTDFAQFYLIVCRFKSIYLVYELGRKLPYKERSISPTLRVLTNLACSLRRYYPNSGFLIITPRFVKCICVIKIIIIILFFISICVLCLFPHKINSTKYSYTSLRNLGSISQTTLKGIKII